MPGKYSSPITILCSAGVAHKARKRLKPAMATSLSVGAVSQFGLMTGGSDVLLEVMLTVPREIGATSAAAMVA